MKRGKGGGGKDSFENTKKELLANKLDLRRFHAWQSSLIFSLTFVLHLIFTFSQVVSFILLAIDIVMILFLSMRAYQDGQCPPFCFAAGQLIWLIV